MQVGVQDDAIPCAPAFLPSDAERGLQDAILQTAVRWCWRDRQKRCRAQQRWVFAGIGSQMMMGRRGEVVNSVCLVGYETAWMAVWGKSKASLLFVKVADGRTRTEKGAEQKTSPLGAVRWKTSGGQALIGPEVYGTLAKLRGVKLRGTSRGAKLR